MSKYIVSTMIQAPANEPVNVNWYKGDSLAQAISAMTSAAAHHEEVQQDASIPASARYTTLGVTLSIEQEVTPAQPEGWCDTHDGKHTLTSGEDGDDPCIDWHTEPDRVRATPSTEDPFFDDFDTETEDPYSLSDCFFWGWKNATDCAGPRIGTAVRRGDEKIVVVCEHHFNSPPE